MLHGLAQAIIVRVKPARFGSKASMPRLKFYQLLVRAIWLPTIIEIAEKAPILAVQRARKPHIDDVVSESGLELRRSGHQRWQDCIHPAI